MKGQSQGLNLELALDCPAIPHMATVRISPPLRGWRTFLGHTPKLQELAKW